MSNYCRTPECQNDWPHDPAVGGIRGCYEKPPAPSGRVRVTVTADATKLCPYVGEDDHGTVEVTFDVAEGDAPELHLLAKALEAAYGQARSHEEFTRWVAKSTGAVRVLTRWRTAGMDVTCDLSRESDR